MTDQADSLESRLDEIFEPHNRSDRPGLVVGVSFQGERIYRKGFGLACVQQRTTNSPATKMRIGSTSKHFTCLLALLLAEDGLLDVDAPASTYLPELPTVLPIPTLRQFMMHTSGYRCSLDVGVMANNDSPQPSGWTLQALARQTELNFAPDAYQMYCNGGYHLLSLAIEKVTGKSFEDVLRDRILRPLGMHDTFALPGDDVFVPGMASQHVPLPDGRWRRGQFMTNDIKGEGSMVSTIDDMLTWLAHMNGAKKVGSEHTWRAMLTPARLKNGHVSVYSLGLFKHDYRGVEVVHHGGSVLGTNSQMITVPSHKLDIVIHVNQMGLSSTELAWKVIDTVLADAGLSDPVPMARHADYPHLVGTRYADSRGVMLGFGEVQDQLGVSFMNSAYMPIFRDTGTSLYSGFEHVALGPFELPLKAIAAGASGEAPERIEFYDSGNLHELRKLPGEPLPLSEAASGLTGRWQSQDAAAEAEILTKGDELLLRLRGDYSGWNEWKLTGWTPEIYGLEGPGMPPTTLAMQVERDDGDVRFFRLNGIRARGLRFDRYEET